MVTRFLTRTTGFQNEASCLSHDPVPSREIHPLRPHNCSWFCSTECSSKSVLFLKGDESIKQERRDEKVIEDDDEEDSEEETTSGTELANIQKLAGKWSRYGH